MSCYITVDATDPNIAAIRGLALGLEALVGLGPIVADQMLFAAGGLLPFTPVSTVIGMIWYVLNGQQR